MRLRAKSMLETIGKDYEEQFVKEENKIDFIQSYLTSHSDELKKFVNQKRGHTSFQL
jgi:hypothetical protein